MRLRGVWARVALRGPPYAVGGRISAAPLPSERADAERKACAVRLRAERRAGELLAGMEKHPPGPDRSERATDLPPTLADMGITKGQSSRWQQLASVPPADLERALADPDAMPSTARLIPSG